MKFEIKHWINGGILFSGEFGSLKVAVEAAVRSGAYLSGADLSGADLSGATLRGATLRGATLRDADLRSADLRDADLRSADLRGADLRDADLRSANLRGVAAALGIDVDNTLPARIVEQITSDPESHDQSYWHSACGTRHCIAGFATHLSGALGKYLDKQLGTATAATLLLWRPGCVMPSFASYATDEETIGRLRVMAAAAAESGAK